MYKRFAALMTVLCMLCSMVPVSFAEEIELSSEYDAMASMMEPEEELVSEERGEERLCLV